VSVEVLRGFSAEETRLTPQNAPVVVLLDATTSMLEQSPHKTPLHVGAQRAASRFANSVEALRPVWLFTMGSGASDACQPTFRGARATNAAARGPLLEEIRQQRPRGESSLARALDSVRGELWRSDVLLGSRVVVFTDVGSECGGDVCAAAAKLLEGGARLDVVAIGERQAPACLREPSGLAESLPPTESADQLTHFRIEVERPERMVAGCSDAGGLPVAVPAGPGTVVVELDPPLRVGAHFAAGRRHVLQVLDFPSLVPPRRHWRWMPVDGATPEPLHSSNASASDDSAPTDESAAEEAADSEGAPESGT
jgi:hypothetical protein